MILPTIYPTPYLLLCLPFAGCGALAVEILTESVEGFFEHTLIKPDTWGAKGKCIHTNNDFLDVMPNILCLDLGTQMGWALQDASHHVKSGSVNLNGKRNTANGLRFLHFRQWLDLQMNTQPIHHVYFEAVYRHKGTHAAHVYGGFMAILQAWAIQHSIPHQGIPIGVWKKAVCGKGNGTKTDVINAVKALGYNPVNDNEADALGILHCVTTDPILF